MLSKLSRWTKRCVSWKKSKSVLVTELPLNTSEKTVMRTELIEKASEVVEDPTVLINMVSKRVRQLNNGRSPLITVVERLGAADIALTEIIEGKIVLDEGEGVRKEE